MRYAHFSLTTLRNMLFFFTATFLTVNLLRLAERSPAAYIASLNVVHSKKILLWNQFFGIKDFSFGEGGRELFQKFNCPVSDCFITSERNLLPYREYDAVVFHGAEYNYIGEKPDERFDNQAYVYFSMESPANRPATPSLNNFFNITMTHRIDSDIFNGYFAIADRNDQVISPAIDPHWMEPKYDKPTIEHYKEAHSKKSKMAAWFVSNCKSANGREEYVKQLQTYMKVDVYGACGKLVCSRNREDVCLNMLKEDYYFYLSFENSDCVDYMTEKVVHPLENDVIPVIYGGTNITRFLPPKSYIDASKMKPQELAQTLLKISKNPETFAKYFWWKPYYKVVKPRSPFCDLCEYLHREPLPKKVYNIVDWWHGNYDHPVCKAKPFS